MHYIWYRMVSICSRFRSLLDNHIFCLQKIKKNLLFCQFTPTSIMYKISNFVSFLFHLWSYNLSLSDTQRDSLSLRPIRWYFCIRELKILCFLEDFKMFRTLAFLCFPSVSVCVHTPAQQQDGHSSEKSQHFTEKTQ